VRPFECSMGCQGGGPYKLLIIVQTYIIAAPLLDFSISPHGPIWKTILRLYLVRI
jgi:hypothetical protein